MSFEMEDEATEASVLGSFSGFNDNYDFGRILTVAQLREFRG
jgi:hypothetical protein